ncbi:hypothetical protein [Rubrivirga sp.]|uniref:hypothetical protein n=1 Tax=Rubrivirga sp. TaxID=1885344 RepID=UPI003B527EC1
MRPLLLAAFLAAPFLAAPLAAQDVVSITPDQPTRGETVTVTFDAPADSVTVTYRPGAITATTETFTPGSTTFEFEPSRAGVVSVAAAGGTGRSLSVRFRGAPLSGIVVMVLAGLVLFGGATLALRALLSDGHRIEMDPTAMPDT